MKKWGLLLGGKGIEVVVTGLHYSQSQEVKNDENVLYQCLLRAVCTVRLLSNEFVKHVSCRDSSTEHIQRRHSTYIQTDMKTRTMSLQLRQ